MSVDKIMDQLDMSRVKHAKVEDVELIVAEKFNRHNKMDSKKWDPIETTKFAVQKILDYSPVYKENPKFKNASELVKNTANYYRRKDGTE